MFFYVTVARFAKPVRSLFVSKLHNYVNAGMVAPDVSLIQQRRPGRIGA
jgi:hypothetical protein